MRKWRILFALLVFIFLACLGGSIYVVHVFTILGSDTNFPDACDPKTPKNTEELGQFKFPPSTNKLTSSCFGLQGWAGHAQFEMSASDLDFFVKNTQVKSPLTKSVTFYDNALATKANNLKSYLYGSYDTVYPSTKTFRQDILIDTSDPNVYLVYIDFSGG